VNNMPHKCTKCGKIYKEGDERVLKGCECGNSMFLYFRKLTHKEADEIKKNRKAKEVKSERLSRAIKEIEGNKSDIWNIKVKDGLYEIDVASLMSKEPIIVEGDEGEYIVSLSSLFEEKKGLRKYIDLIRK